MASLRHSALKRSETESAMGARPFRAGRRHVHDRQYWTLLRAGITIRGVGIGKTVLARDRQFNGIMVNMDVANSTIRDLMLNGNGTANVIFLSLPKLWLTQLRLRTQLISASLCLLLLPIVAPPMSHQRPTTQTTMRPYVFGATQGVPLPTRRS